ncbi:hypothetical protein B5X24_HaOG212527 [Helicoverpa armigera]|nr:hypothetical protein B5X24_HaOG212527 [Helicoverpa armigera]
MTICDRADSPFVKTTIFENNKETTLKTLLNNNLETASKPPEIKLENTVKTTIYDNKLEDINTLNRVPKLTVRVPKELLDKDSSSDYSSDSDVSDKLTVDENTTIQEEEEVKTKAESPTEHPPIEPLTPPAEVKVEESLQPDEDIQVKDENEDVKPEPKPEPEMELEQPAEPTVEEPTIPVTELSLDKPLDKYPLKDLLKVFLSSTVHSCIYCNHVRKIAVNCEQLALHMVAQHRFAATVDSITAEELMPETITAKLKTDLNEVKPTVPIEVLQETSKDPVPIIDLDDIKPKEEAGTSEPKAESGTEQLTKKEKKKKLKDKDALLLDVNLPALNLSESDSSDESDSGIPPTIKDEKIEEKIKEEDGPKVESTELNRTDDNTVTQKTEEKTETLDEKPNEQQVLDIWDNFKKYQAKVEKTKEKTPPLVPIRKHVCESDHDYCLVPTDMNGDEDLFNSSDTKKKNKKSPKKQRGDLSSTSSSSSDSDSSCSCGSNCSCSSSSGSSSSSSSDSDSSDDSGNEKEKKKTRRLKKVLPNRRCSTGSNVDVMGVSETPILIPEKTEPPIAETDLDTDESETDEEFYDEHPQRIGNKLYEEKRNQLMNLSSVAPSDAGSISGEPSRPTTPIKEEEKEEKEPKEEPEVKVKSASKKKSKKKKKSKNSKKHGPIKINIPKDIISKSEVETPAPLIPNKITISLQSNTVQIPEAPKPSPIVAEVSSSASSAENKRASKRRRVPNKFYGYSSDEEAPQPHTPVAALKPQQPPKLEWRKEDLPSPVTHKAKKEVPSTVISSRLYNYTDPIRLTAPIPDPEPPRILMNSESMESSDSDSSEEGNLEIYQPTGQSSVPPPPTYLNSGTSSLPYAFQRPAVREAREGESVYCYCRCPYDEVSEMIACDAEGCPIEWFHFECVGIMVPPKGKWYCPECRKNQSFSGYR